MTFPVGQEAFCEAAVSAARDFMALKGCPVEIKSSYTVALRPGTEKVDGAWAWFDEKWGWCSGMTYRVGDSYHSQLGCNPETMDEIRPCDAMHESLEYWAKSNFGCTVHELAAREGWEL
jgi:hypothetical protein